MQPKQRSRHAVQADDLATSCDDSRCNMGPGNPQRQPRQIDWQLAATMADATRAGHCGTTQPWAVDWHATTRSGSQQRCRQVQPRTRQCSMVGKRWQLAEAPLGACYQTISLQRCGLAATTVGAAQAARQNLKQAHPDGLHVGLLVGRHVLLQAQQSTLSQSGRSKQGTRRR